MFSLCCIFSALQLGIPHSGLCVGRIKLSSFPYCVRIRGENGAVGVYKASETPSSAQQYQKPRPYLEYVAARLNLASQFGDLLVSVLRVSVLSFLDSPLTLGQ